MDPNEGHAALAERLASVARLIDTDSVHETLQLTVDLAVETIPGCTHAGVSIMGGGRISTPAATDSVALRVDAIQYEAGEGPCLEATAPEGPVRTDDLSRDTRWPAFSARAHAETGIHSMLAFRLYARDRTLGALNLFSEKVAAFDEDAEQIGVIFAVHVALAIRAAQKTEGLMAALTSRDVIGQAKGILMEREHVSDEEAFRILVRASQRLNIKLTAVAERLTAPDPGKSRKAAL